MQEAEIKTILEESERKIEIRHNSRQLFSKITLIYKKKLKWCLKLGDNSFLSVNEIGSLTKYLEKLNNQTKEVQRK